LQAGGATASRSELRGLTQYYSDRKALDGPAMRPETPLALENSVGKPAAPEAPNVGIGKESVAQNRSKVKSFATILQLLDTVGGAG
jgi:hypothetical protein